MEEPIQSEKEILYYVMCTQFIHLFSFLWKKVIKIAGSELKLVSHSKGVTFVISISEKNGSTG